jgi:hypothetical protein
VRTALDELGYDDVDVRMLEIETDEQARRYGFRGSPTVLIDDVDLIEVLRDDAHATGPEADSALSCRLYRRRDGRIAPTPDPADVREALIRATHRRQNQRSDT